MKLPQVHIAVNVTGLLTAIGGVASLALSPQGQSCLTSLPAHDALAATAIAGAIAAFLPTKKGASN